LIFPKTRSQALVAEVDLEEIVEAVVALAVDAEALVAEVDLAEIAEALVAEAALVAEEASEVEEAAIVVAVEVLEAEVASTLTLSTKIRAILSLLLGRKPHSERMGSFLLC
jgi:hypothetical protein